MSYHIFSHFYDKVMDQSVYNDWLSFVQLHHEENKTLEIMELACGTGIIAVQLAKQGHTVTGVDLSSEMLALANERMINEDVKIMLVESDMRELEVLGQYDLVTCFSDSLCYLTDELDLVRVFENVYHNLKEDGLFLFDVHSLYQMNEVFPGYQYIYQDEEGAFLWESYALDEPDSVEHVLTFFVPQENGLFEQLQEVHEERSFPLEVYKQLLRQVGFRDVQVTADFGEETLDETTPRWFFTCKK